MTPPRRNLAVYALLAMTWPAVVGWLVFEHGKVVDLARETMITRAREISDTIALLSRSGGPGVIRQSRLQESLDYLTHSRKLITIQLLNGEGEVVVASGEPLKLKFAGLAQRREIWERDRLILVNPVEFGSIATDERGTTRPITIVLPPRDDSPPADDRRPPRQGGEDGSSTPPSERRPSQESGSAERRADSPGARDRSNPGGRESDRGGDRDRGGNRDRGGDRDRANAGGREPNRGGGGPGRFRPPPWMDRQQYEILQRTRGLHDFVLVLPTVRMVNDINRDLWLRVTMAGLALLAVGGLALGWRNTEDSTRLQMRLVRAHELNLHLQEMNVAAAGLAHETRNPLNIVRGLAQMIAQREDLTGDLRDRSRQITEEVDRVTGRLNEFINYSRPPEPRPAPTVLTAIVNDVVRTLESDLNDKQIQFELSGPTLTVNADESLLRQILFNLLLNAAQAVEPGGRVGVVVANSDRGEASLSVEDNGPGVPDDIREEIFRPYFTTNKHGTGLGLAVVKQIVLAHRWEIEYVRSPTGGAAFRISGLQIL